MLISLPIGILLAAGLVILGVRWIWPRFPYTWLIAAASAGLCWLLTIYLRLRLPSTLSFPAWKPADLFHSSPVIVLDFVSWPFALALASLVLAEILTGVARTQPQPGPSSWVAAVALGGLGLFGVMSGNPLTLLLAWGAADLCEITIVLFNVHTREMSSRSVAAYAAKSAGLFFALWAVLTSRTHGPSLTWEMIQPGAALFLLLAAALRLGVLPLHLPFPTDPGIRRGLGTLLRLIPAASSLMLLARLPTTVAQEPWANLLVGFAALAGLYASIMWTLAENEISGRPYWLIGASSLAVISALHGQPGASLAWGLVLLISGGLIFLYSAHGKRSALFWVLAAACIAGLPFTPAAGGWAGLVGGAFSFWNILAVLTVEFLIFGFIRHATRASDDLSQMERWVQSIYPSGLVVLVASELFLGYKGWEGSFTAGTWWVSVPVAAIILWLSVWWAYRRGRAGSGQLSVPVPGWAYTTAVQGLNGLTGVLRLEWVYRLLWRALVQVDRILSALTTIFEGDGGVLWALLLMTVIVTLLQVRVGP